MQINLFLAILAVATAVLLCARTVKGQAAENRIALAGTFGGALTNKARIKFWSGEGSMTEESMDMSGTKRQYYLYKPPGARQGMPVVFALHGGGGTARGMDRLCGGITSTADRYGFAVVFPQGLKHHWNDGRDANARDVDDVAFISNVTDRLIANGTADRKRIYATGISNGGFFSQYLASKLSDRFAAVASVAASLAAEATENKSEQPVAIAFFLGTKDPIVPFQGGTIGFKSLSVDRGKALSANQAISFWLANNHTAAGSITEKVLDDGKMSVSKTDYGEPGSRSEVVFYQINGGGHTWPGGLQYLPPTVIGRVCPLNANDLIFDFFSHHSL